MQEHCSFDGRVRSASVGSFTHYQYIKHERQCFIGISKHREESWKYDAQRRICNEIQGVWIADETLSRVFDISYQQLSASVNFRRHVTGMISQSLSHAFLFSDQLCCYDNGHQSHHCICDVTAESWKHLASPVSLSSSSNYIKRKQSLDHSPIRLLA